MVPLLVLSLTPHVRGQDLAEYVQSRNAFAFDLYGAVSQTEAGSK